MPEFTEKEKNNSAVVNTHCRINLVETFKILHLVDSDWLLPVSLNEGRIRWIDGWLSVTVKGHLKTCPEYLSEAGRKLGGAEHACMAETESAAHSPLKPNISLTSQRI